ncbi:MAG: PQQ-binding-like beta-propeller repeat protein, partial [Verrucomicrobiales bacterium]|nr:PQQ-binding-like beta-propeller repeat protein [Verrucomicrobiales bacterium]
AKGKLRTQFIAEPKFSPMPQQTVIGGGRMYKAMGHIAHKQNGNQHLNTLMCINAYNGTILWRRPLPAGFMIHRNTMIATGDSLLLGDHESCKIIDGETGAVRDSISIPDNLTDGPTWKWMGLEDGILYALIGHAEVKVETRESDSPGIGHWPWGMWKGHDYEDPEKSFGFGRTLVAIDIGSREVLWHHRESDYIDARALVMNRDKIFYYIHGKYLAAIDRNAGTPLWKNSDENLIEAVGVNGRAQHYMTGYATTNYMKCSSDQVYFAGPQRKQMVAASADDGRLLWTNPAGNLQLVLRRDAVYAAGQQGTKGIKLDYRSGKVLSEFPARRACTRATGGEDSIFFRAGGGTVRVMTETDTALHIAPMRPACQDGVLISNGHFYWGPWMCGCQLSLYGNIGLAPAGQAGNDHGDTGSLTVYSHKEVEPLYSSDDDWQSFRGDESRSDVSPVAVADSVKRQWSCQVSTPDTLPTAPVAAGGMVFVADRSGLVHGFSGDSGEKLWSSYTGGPVYYPPVVRHDRLYVGSADGQVWCLAATTGEAMWSYRVGPGYRNIPVFGQLVSSWPVAGGVVVKDQTVYAAAGITHYDGTVVVSLDAITGKLKASNSESGTIASEVDNGISLQGNLQIVNNELRFAGGGVYEWARYDLDTLACLNQPKVQVHSDFRTAFYPYYPNYNKYVSLEHKLDDDRELVHYANYEGRYFINLSLRKPGKEQVRKDAAGEFIRRANRSRGVSSQKRDIWRDPHNRRFTAFAVTPGYLVAAGHTEAKPEAHFLVSTSIEEGTDRWIQEIPAQAVKGGVAIDAKGKIYCSVTQRESELHQQGDVDFDFAFLYIQPDLSATAITE